MLYDVIIVGAGPSGLSFAKSLSGLGLKIAILEKQPLASIESPAFDGRDIALTHHSANLLKQLGAWQKIADTDIAPIKEARVMDGVSPYFLHFNHQTTKHSALGYLVSNHFIRQSLFDIVANLPDVTLLTDVEAVTVVHIDPRYTTISLSNGACIDTRLLVAADSRFSSIRRKVGIAAQVKDFGHSVIVSRMSHTQSNQHIAHECFYYGKTLALLPVKENISSVVITVPNRESDHILQMGQVDFANMVTEWFGHRLGDMTSISERFHYPLVAVHAEQFIGDRFALIGDAAVGMHPVTAHGFNLGLSGQAILAQRIQQALQNDQDFTSYQVLNTYQRLHRRQTKPLYHGTNRIVSIYTNDSRPATLLRKGLLHVSNRFWPIKKAILNQLTQA